MTNALADTIFWIAVASCTIAQVAILRSIFNPAPRGAPAAVAGARPVRRGMEGLWAVLPAVGLALVLALTWREMHERRTPVPGAQPTHSVHSVR